MIDSETGQSVLDRQMGFAVFLLLFNTQYDRFGIDRGFLRPGQ